MPSPRAGSGPSQPHNAAAADEVLESEVRQALTLFHELGHVTFYDDDELRHLVVLDPQWLVDAITVVIREHKSGNHAHPIDVKVRVGT